MALWRSLRRVEIGEIFKMKGYCQSLYPLPPQKNSPSFYFHPQHHQQCHHDHPASLYFLGISPWPVSNPCPLTLRVLNMCGFLLIISIILFILIIIISMYIGHHQFKHWTLPTNIKVCKWWRCFPPGFDYDAMIDIITNSINHQRLPWVSYEHLLMGGTMK